MKTKKNQIWNANEAIEFEVAGEKQIVNPGDALLKRDGILHGCVCLEEGILLDIFTPMREEFV